MSKHSRQQVSTHGSKYTCHVIFSDMNKKVSVLMPEKLRRWVGSAAKPILMYMRQGPALPKNAILAAHGYKAHEVYDPVWRHVQVPEQFLKLVCPMAERLYSEVVGRENLVGTANYWSISFPVWCSNISIMPRVVSFQAPSISQSRYPELDADDLPNGTCAAAGDQGESGGPFTDSG